MPKSWCRLSAYLLMGGLLLPARISSQSYPSIWVVKLTCSTSNPYSDSVTVSWNDPNNPDPQDYVVIGSSATGWVPMADGNSGTASTNIYNGVYYAINLFSAAGSQLAGTTAYCDNYNE